MLFVIERPLCCLFVANGSSFKDKPPMNVALTNNSTNVVEKTGEPLFAVGSPGIELSKNNPLLQWRDEVQMKKVSGSRR